MTELPHHDLPPYSEDARDDALFHYTTATGLIGILKSGSMWSTAFYCANDESELAVGEGVLSSLLQSATQELIEANDPRFLVFSQRNVDIFEYARQFERTISGALFFPLCAHITCFYKPANEEDFHHGLLSQWRGYGSDGGYALQFSRKKLNQAINNIERVGSWNYSLLDVYYNAENPLKANVLRHQDAYIQAYMEYLNELAKPLEHHHGGEMRRSMAMLTEMHGPLDAYFAYLIHTKNKHFAEERECRLSHFQIVSKTASQSSNYSHVNYYNRNGLLVPYTSTPNNIFKLLECIEWIIVGPSPRLDARLKSVSQIVRQYGLNINVRPSHIPFTRS